MVRVSHLLAALYDTRSSGRDLVHDLLELQHIRKNFIYLHILSRLLDFSLLALFAYVQGPSRLGKFLGTLGSRRLQVLAERMACFKPASSACKKTKK